MKPQEIRTVQIIQPDNEAHWLEVDAVEMNKRIERHIVRIPESGCWIWIGCTTHDGYGRMMVIDKSGKQRPIRAHRISYAANNGRFKKSEIVRHECDIPLCVNPHHLSLGTQQDNLFDMRSRQRDRGIGVYNRLKTHCNSGHPLFGDNLRIEGKAKARRCKTCESIKKGRKS
jgi:hypothetical protein